MKLAEILALTPEKLNKMTKVQLQSAVKSATKVTQGRLRQINKSGKISMAKESYFPNGFGGYHKNKSRNQLLASMVKQIMFLNAKTSTINGIKAVEREQDARLFGTNGRGTPLGSMSQEDRKKMWTTYMIFNEDKRYNSMLNVMGSARLQQFFASEAVKGNLDDEDYLSKAYNKLLTEYNEKTQEESEELGDLFGGTDIGGNSY